MSDHSELFAFPNVVGVGIGFKRRGGEIVRDEHGNPVEAVVVSVVKKIAPTVLKDNERVPTFVGDSPTDVIEVGQLSALDHVDPTQRHRPATPGLSVGLNPGVTAGSIGFIVTKPLDRDRRTFILSNWHVLAASNVPIADRDILTITQPGNHDGGRVPVDTIGLLEEFVPVGTTPPDLSDCSIAGAVAWLPNAIARVFGSNTRLVPTTGFAVVAIEQKVDAAIAAAADISLHIPHIGVVTEWQSATLGMSVKKFGRTTAFTTGVVSQIGASFLIQGYPDGPVMFTDQVAIDGDDGPFLQGGDSGSGLVNESDRAVGLCFAGSDVIGIANQFYNVQNALDIVLATP